MGVSCEGAVRRGSKEEARLFPGCEVDAVRSRCLRRATQTDVVATHRNLHGKCRMSFGYRRYHLSSFPDVANLHLGKKRKEKEKAWGKGLMVQCSLKEFKLIITLEFDHSS